MLATSVDVENVYLAPRELRQSGADLDAIADVLGEMLRNLGCVNLADGEESLLEDLSIEYILQEDPDYIFIVQRGDNLQAVQEYVQQMMAEHPAWSHLTAVQNDRVYFMDKNLYNLKPNHRWGEAYRGLEDILSHG